MSSRPRHQFPQPLQAKENASSRPRSGCVRVKSTCPHRSICESLSMFVLLFRLFWFYCSTKKASKKESSSAPLRFYVFLPFSYFLAGQTSATNRLRI